MSNLDEQMARFTQPERYVSAPELGAADPPLAADPVTGGAARQILTHIETGVPLYG